MGPSHNNTGPMVYNNNRTDNNNGNNNSSSSSSIGPITRPPSGPFFPFCSHRFLIKLSNTKKGVPPVAHSFHLRKQIHKQSHSARFTTWSQLLVIMMIVIAIIVIVIVVVVVVVVVVAVAVAVAVAVVVVVVVAAVVVVVVIIATLADVS